MLPSLSPAYLALICALLVATNAQPGDWWYFASPTPDAQQLQAYEELYAPIAAAHHINGPGPDPRPMLKPVRFEDRQDDPFLFRERIVEKGNRDMGK